MMDMMITNFWTTALRSRKDKTVRQGQALDIGLGLLEWAWQRHGHA